MSRPLCPLSEGSKFQGWKREATAQLLSFHDTKAESLGQILCSLLCKIQLPIPEQGSCKN